MQAKQPNFQLSCALTSAFIGACAVGQRPPRVLPMKGWNHRALLVGANKSVLTRQPSWHPPYATAICRGFQKIVARLVQVFPS